MINTSLKILSVAIASTLIVSCSNSSNIVKDSTPIKESLNNDSHVAVKTVSKVETIEKCRQTQRDLSLTWEQRKYWCTHSGRVVSFKNRDKQYVELVNAVTKSNHDLNRVQSSLDNAISEMDQDIPAKHQSANKITTNTIKNTPSIKPITVLPKKKVVPVNKVIPVSKASSDISVLPELSTNISKKVWFTNEIEYLDSSNQHIALSLLPDAKLARKVILRGHIQPGEVVSEDDIEFERFSVGRSLSIKKLFIEQGVDKSKIKILHFRNNPEGRYVEVKFHG